MPYRISKKGALQGSMIRGKTLMLAPPGTSMYPAVIPISQEAANKLWIKVAGVWKQATTYIKVAGVWKTATPKINVSGTWR
jgi:hypothetical protein